MITVHARPGSRVDVGGQSVTIPNSAGIPVLVVPLKDLAGHQDLTVRVTRGDATEQFPVAVPGRAVEVHSAMPLLAPGVLEPTAITREGDEWTLEFTACHVRKAEGEGAMEVEASTLRWKLPFASVGRQRVDQEAIALPSLVLTGTDGKAITVSPAVPSVSLLTALAASIRTAPLAAASAYRQKAPLLITGDGHGTRLINIPSAGVHLLDVAAVALVETSAVVVDECRYGTDRTVRQNRRIDARVTLVETRSGRLIASTTVHGAARPCPSAIYRGPDPLLSPFSAVPLGARLDTGFGFQGDAPNVEPWLRRF